MVQYTQKKPVIGKNKYIFGQKCVMYLNYTFADLEGKNA